MVVTEGTAYALSSLPIKVAGKSGTAEVGVTRANVNSWINTYFPYESPRYALSIVMEKGPSEHLVSSTLAAKQFLEWIYANAQEYLK